ncbi:hypothetical protein MHK_008124 [Candidatus Magnetomorum sp. HK-1]|nr:hypothetical protein MHK_008124 [Candidatus Magnetomorum sp. HK-1]
MENQQISVNKPSYNNNIPQDLKKSQARLEQFGIISNNDGELAFTSELFKVWLQRRC